MRIVVTGAGGFLGRATTAALAARRGGDEVVLLDQVAVPIPDGRFRAEKIDLADAAQAQSACRDADVVIHLAAMPGGAAEADPAGSRRTNLQAPLTMLASCPKGTRFVYASSIAVFGADLPSRVDDETLPRPALTYGAHKLMVETALADGVRRGDVEGVALRFPGIVARPGDGAGLRSAFMNMIFHAMAESRDLTLPVGPEATLWLMSVRVAAENLLHAAFGDMARMERAVLTLPVVRTSMENLVATIRKATNSRSRIEWQPDARLEAVFGAYPELDAGSAETAGFRSDGTVQRLVDHVFADRKAYAL